MGIFENLLSEQAGATDKIMRINVAIHTDAHMRMSIEQNLIAELRSLSCADRTGISPI